MNDQEQKCDKDGVFFYTWPGQDQALVCLEHAEGIKAVANAIGSQIEMIPTMPGFGSCSSVVGITKRSADAEDRTANAK